MRWDDSQKIIFWTASYVNQMVLDIDGSTPSIQFIRGSYASWASTGLKIFLVRNEVADPPPHGSSSCAQFICCNEWALSSMQNRLDNQYSGKRNRQWILSKRLGQRWRWTWYRDYYLLSSWTGELDPVIVASHMLLTLWKYEVDAGLLREPPHWIANEGLLGVPAIYAIQREIRGWIGRPGNR